ncbi:diguanylate cyclase (GGDEF) domain-containing protein [Peptoclostridium litorale DSM 5388]|uniref:GGDEF domain-containing protein n=1 Tax=Peptoclostridium litorale DSM 5388 TaxID=1121324 RepID=A0A069REI5_PEPLI|nr:diguanylate cyclase [Peptoclostridium litorale]KDR95451.1 hypothetical protein CLIT_10c01780 [Peptoclostridium litorale DSM 5388]SIO18448.1 diguanylate cyclase (GGDEF) domain-containing protein [Peptoclostridium litorale DSM 5388]
MNVKKEIRIKKTNSVAYRNVLILLFSLLPFFIGIIFSIHKGGDMEYFGAAINISGSQRMRTMLIANYAQQIEDAYQTEDEKHLNEAKAVLSRELQIYEEYMDALYNGSEELDLMQNDFPKIKEQIESYEDQYKRYDRNAKQVIEDPTRADLVDEIVLNALDLKNNIHEVVELYQQQYDEDLGYLRVIDFSMIIVAVLVTILGLFLTRSIKKHEYFANFDHLTGLLTRYNLYENTKNKNADDHALFFIDLNKFKYINDTFGHAIGDEILIEVANRLIEVFGREQVYRFGGDEFVVILQPTEYDSDDFLDSYVRTLKNRIAIPIIDAHNRAHFVGMSVGAVNRHMGLGNWDSLIRFADGLMYDAKSIAGHVIICNTAGEAKERMNIVEEVEEALLEDVLVNDDTVDTLKNLSDMGYTLAVDNFTVDISLKESVKYKNIKVVKLGKPIIDSLMIDSIRVKC